MILPPTRTFLCCLIGWFVGWLVGVSLGLDPLQKLRTDYHFHEILEDAYIGKEEVAEIPEAI